jgi:3-dehydroquinate dehydratase
MFKDKNTVLRVLEYMQQYSGTIKTCIFMAMGYED